MTTIRRAMPLVAALLLGGASAGVSPSPVRDHLRNDLPATGGGQPIDPAARLPVGGTEWHSQLPLPPRFLLTSTASTDSTINVTRPLEGAAWTVGESLEPALSRSAPIALPVPVLHHVSLCPPATGSARTHTTTPAARLRDGDRVESNRHRSGPVLECVARALPRRPPVLRHYRVPGDEPVRPPRCRCRTAPLVTHTPHAYARGTAACWPAPLACSVGPHTLTSTPRAIQVPLDYRARLLRRRGHQLPRLD